MGSSDMAAQDEFGSTGSDGVVSASNGISVSAGGVQLKDDQFYSGNDFTPKVRKPYTITKQRERWTEEEHNKFLEALKLYGRAWRKIEEHVGAKTAVQIRSHAQKFFSKVARDPNGGNTASEEPIGIPPPRPKRKPMRPYPRKLVHPLNKETSTVEQPARSTSPNLSVSEQENQSPKSVLSVIGSDAMGSTDSNTPSDGLSPDSSAAGVNSGKLLSVIGSDAMGSTDSNTPSDGLFPDSSAAGVNSGKLIHSEPNPLIEESGSTINNCSLPNKQLTMKLELFPADDVDASGGSAEEASARSLKLFGRTVLVTDSHRPSSQAAGDSKSLPSDVQEEKLVQTSLPCNITDMESASGNVEHVWDNFPYGGHQGIYFMQFQNQNSNAVESGTNAYPVPRWTICPPFIPFHKQQQPANEHVDSKKVEREGSCTGSDAGTASDDENRDKEVETQGDQHVSDKDREPNSVLQFKVSANSAFSVLRASTGKNRKGFVPYKRCVAERDAKSSTMASEDGDGKRVRLSF